MDQFQQVPGASQDAFDTLNNKIAKSISINALYYSETALNAAYAEFADGTQGMLYASCTGGRKVQYIVVRENSNYGNVLVKPAGAQTISAYLDNGTWKFCAFNDLAGKIISNVQANSSSTFDLTGKIPCLVAVGRTSTSSTGRLAFIDAWGGIVNLVTHTSYTLSMSGNTLTVQNGGNSYASVLITY